MRIIQNPLVKYAWTAAAGALCLVMASPSVTTQSLPPSQEVSENAMGQSAVAVGRLSPNGPAAEAAVAPLSGAERDALVRRHIERREAMDRQVNNRPASPAGVPSGSGIEVRPGSDASTDYHTPPALSAVVIGRNAQNTRASTAGVGSTLAEPTAVNEGPNVFYAGNTHAEFSTNGGATFPNPVGIPAGPASAPFACCDLDSVYDQARGVTFWLVLYLNGSATQGTVRIFVRRQIPLANSCAYDITPGAGIVPDYPHLGLSNNHLYLSTNNVSANGAFLRVTRFDINTMADCAATPFSTFSLAPAVGQRVVVPVDGARSTMYFAYHENATQMRIFFWPDTAAGPASVLRAVTAHNHANPDCRGGANNTDWIERGTSFSITGFRMRGTIGAGRLRFWWNVSADAAAGHNQAHVHAAVFNESGLSLAAQPHLFNGTNCIGYPNVGVNERGDVGLSLAFGGRAGGGGTPVQGYVGIDDDFTPGIGNFNPIFLVAAGTHNPAGSAFDPPRWGDYVSVKAHEPCDLGWTATSYAHNGGTGVANINARYVEFLRGRDNQCYVGWRDETRIP